MELESGGLAVFVKTPGVSKVKTRLAKSIGQEAAETFYKYCIEATASYVRAVKTNSPQIQVYWAVAEEVSLDAAIWKEFPVIYQGEGELGRRMSRVYSELLRRHDVGCLIGADSPHMNWSELKENVEKTLRNRNKCFQVGKTEDGGFHFFGGALSLPETAWISVEYSTSDTALNFVKQLSLFAQVENVPGDFDVDTLKDLDNYRDPHFSKNDKLLPEQIALMEWVRKLKFDI